MVQLGSDGRLSWHRRLDGDGELNFPSAQRNRHSAGCIPCGSGQAEFYGRSGGRYAGIVPGVGHHLLGVAINRPAAYRKIWPVCSDWRSEEHTSELQSLTNIVCRLLLEKK